MTLVPERGFFELYANDPERADALIFGRRAEVDRRGFLGGAGLAAMGAFVGASIPFARFMPSGLIPAAQAQTPADAPKMLKMDGKADLILLQEKPLNAEAPAHFLDDAVTPAEKFFIRNNGGVPDPIADANSWKLVVDGEVNKKLELTLGELKRRFKPVTLQLQLECGGNGRSFFTPETRGNQWGHGAVGCAQWTGVPLAEVLKAAGLKPSAVYTGHYGADPHLSGDPNRPTISRGVPIKKAMDEHTLIAWAMNGKPIPQVNGAPLRLVVPGWPGSASQKWVTRIWVRDKVHDGPGMGGFSYRVTRTPMVPGGKTPETNTRILESMPVRSVITNVAHGTELATGTRELGLRGHAWAGEKTVRAVHVSIDYGATWRATEVLMPRNKYAWQRWRTKIRLPSEGYYEIWARATDADGRAQPSVAGNWNPQGYGGNPMHRVAVLVKA
ncbi:MAG TPA: sulfite oxidase [Alphaproteobacteria bacterium]|nr:sulfite oxidase [Alphaproteobacteria bacterium]